MQSNHSMMSRRRFAAGFALGSVALALPLPSLALTVDDARALIDKAVRDINATIDSGKSEQAMYGDFERIFIRYADVPAIARSALGVAAKSASMPCSRIASGVVLLAAFCASTKPLPMVPITAVFRPIAVNACAIHWLTDVLPFVPVTPIMLNLREGCP